MPHLRYIMNCKKSWSNNEVITLISMFKSMPCLWEVNSPDYVDKGKKSYCLNDLALYFKTSPIEVKRKIHYLRNQYNREMLKLSKRKAIFGSHSRCVSKWSYFNSLRFLKKSYNKKYRGKSSELHYSGNRSSVNECTDNISGGTAEPTSTVNVKQEPVDISENEQDGWLMKDDNRMEAQSSRLEQNNNKSELQNNKSEAHCSKMDVSYSSHNNCKIETCCNRPVAHCSRTEPNVQCGVLDTMNNRSDIHSNRSEIHNSRADIHNNRSDVNTSRSENTNRPDIHLNLHEPHSSRSEVPHCSRTESFRMLKVEPNTERINRRNDHIDTSSFLTSEVRRHGRNENRHAHCRHRADSMSSTLIDPPSFTSVNETTQLGLKREKQWLEDDQCDIFGKFVASELKSLNSEYLRKKMKRKIQRAILDVCEEEEHY